MDIVGPTAGKQLQRQAWLATIYSLIGMLVYLWFRFELIYGVAAVVAVFHDTLITVGAFSLTNQEITLTVIAAILTLIGYSMNDTIVVFDRIRENLATNRRESLSDVVNRSINQTLSRTVISSGLTFLTVLSLYLFGGEVLHGFSFALVIGILIGTYSSIAVAAPMLVAYQDWRASRGQAGNSAGGQAVNGRRSVGRGGLGKAASDSNGRIAGVGPEAKREQFDGVRCLRQEALPTVTGPRLLMFEDSMMESGGRIKTKSKYWMIVTFTFERGHCC